MKKQFCLIFLFLVSAVHTSPQQLDFSQAAVTEPAELAKAMPQLARSVIALYRESDREKYLDNLFRLQLVAGDDRAGPKSTLRCNGQI